MKSFQKALSIVLFGFLSAVAIRCSTPSIVATQSIRTGDEMNNQNRYDEAIKSYEDYLKVSPQLGVYRNVSMEADVCRKLAHAYSTQGKYRQALRYLERALGTDTTIVANGLEVVEDYRQIGMVQGYSGNYKDALRYLEKSMHLNLGMERSAKSIKQSSVAETYLALAQLNLTLGNYEQANQYAQQALSLYTKIPNEFSSLWEAHLIIGIVARDKGDLIKAISHLESSRTLAEGQKANTTRQLQALGEVYFMQGDVQTSIRYKTQAVEEAEKSNIKPQIIIAYMRLGDAYQQLGDADRADVYYKKALEIQAKMTEGDTVAFVPANLKFGNIQQAYEYHIRSGSSIGGGLVSLRLGEMMYANTNLDSATLLFKQAKEFFEKAGSKEGLAKANLELAKTLTSKKSFQQAQQFLDEALRQTIQPDLKWQIYYRQGILSVEQGLTDMARSQFEQAITIIDDMRGNLTVEELKTTFANTKVEVYDQLILLLLRNKDQWKDLTSQQAIARGFLLSEQARSRTFLDMLGNRKVEPKNNRDTLLLNEEQLLRLKMQRLVQEINKGGENQEQFIKELEKTDHQHLEVLEKIKLSNTAYASVVTIDPPTIAEIQSKIDPQTALVEYWISNNELLIWVVSKSKVDVERVNISRAALLREVSAARRGITMQLDITQNRLKSLYAHLVQPIEARIAPFKNIVFVPHQSLHFLPFQTIITPTGKFLVEQFVVSYAPSAAVYYYCLNKPYASGNSFFAGALGDISIGDFPGLPGTEIELDQLSRIYDKFEKQTQADFQETSFKQNIHDYNYIHVATHGVFNKQQPLYSYLLMGGSDQDDGRLTVNEIFGLNVNSKFVTLSACETALGELGEADDLIGLSRAFIYAGTPGVVVSLWQVDDATTAWLMTRFYQYLNGGNSVAEALTYAQRDLIQRNFTSTKARGIKEVVLNEKIKIVMNSKTAASARNPYFWAPFIFIGNSSIK